MYELATCRGSFQTTKGRDIARVGANCRPLILFSVAVCGSNYKLSLTS